MHAQRGAAARRILILAIVVLALGALAGSALGAATADWRDETQTKSGYSPGVAADELAALYSGRLEFPVEASNEPADDPLLRAIDARTGLPFEWQAATANLERALRLSPGSPTVRVGIIDSGVADIPDLAGKVDERWTVTSKGKVVRDSRSNDYVGHGTAVASIIAANTGDGFGMTGFGGAAHLVVVRAWPLTDAAVAAALRKLDALGVRIVNLSFGHDAPLEPALVRAIKQANSHGMLIVAAAGNSAGVVAHPAADLQAPDGSRSYGLSVGASDVNGGRAGFSNAGAGLSLVAPGGYDGPCTGVLVALAPLGSQFDDSCSPNWTGERGAGYAYLSGTSFAAPQVAGVAALIWAARPELTNYQVTGIIKETARRTAAGWTAGMGCGVLDAAAALELTLSRSAEQWENESSIDWPCSAL